MERAFHEHDIVLRITGETLALTPPLIISENQIGEIADKLRAVIRAVA
jgi:beta-alanine--pyruvate transaminase